MKLSLTSAILSTLFAIGCGSVDSPSNGVLIPLKTGNTWNYEVGTFDVNQPISYTKLPETDFVGLATTIKGKQYYFYNHDGTGSNSSVSIFRNDKSGLWEFSELTDSEQFDFQYPAQTGSRHSVFGDRINTLWITVVSTNEQVVTPAGTFACYHYLPEMDSNLNVTSSTNLFIAPNIGIVKLVDSSFFFKDGVRSIERVTTRELTSYSLK